MNIFSFFSPFFQSAGLCFVPGLFYCNLKKEKKTREADRLASRPAKQLPGPIPAIRGLQRQELARAPSRVVLVTRITLGHRRSLEQITHDEALAVGGSSHKPVRDALGEVNGLCRTVIDE